MSGDITAINTWARSTAQRANAVAQNTGCSTAEALERIMLEDRSATKAARTARFTASTRRAKATT